MFTEIEIADFFLQIILGFISFNYTKKFLRKNFEENKKISVIWTIIYAATHFFLSQITENRFLTIILQILILYLLQKKFFVQDKFKQIFILSSFIAGWEILRFTASPLAHAIFSVWNPVWNFFINFFTEKNIFDAEKIIFLIGVSNRIAIFFVIIICRAIQLLIFIFYLKIILKKFSRNFKLNFQSTIFLIFPCVTVFLIDLTIRLIAFSADNGAIFLIYERVPEIIFLLPVVSLLLLGIIISTVILFENFLQYKDEEQKRILLENRVVEIHREISELEEIYSEIRGLRHDMRNHLENIFEYVKKNSEKNFELENYLKNMSETVEKLNFSYKTGNPITDIILHRFKKISQKKNISFTADFKYKKIFDVYDIGIILNNALQNAIEAAEKISGEKFIKIFSYERGGLYFIEIENNFNGDINFGKKNLPETAKSDKNFHGIGLENIRNRAKKYSGEIDIEIEEKIFKLTVMLYK